MLKKLYKHEFKALLRWLIFVWIGIIVLAILNRGSTALLQGYTENHLNMTSSNSDYIMQTLLVKKLLTSLTTALTVIYALGAVAGMFISYGLVIVRFYKNLFTSEGYFTFSIPVSPVQHIWCKLICGMAMILASTVVVIISLIINFVFTEIGSSISNSIGSLFETIELIDFAHLMGYMVEFSIAGILYVGGALLQVYCAISFGQGFKNKIGGSVVSYIIINVILNAVSSFLSVFFVFTPQLFIEIFNAVPAEFIVHLMMFFAITIEVALCAAFFIITAYKTTKKLNLE